MSRALVLLVCVVLFDVEIADADRFVIGGDDGGFSASRTSYIDNESRAVSGVEYIGPSDIAKHMEFGVVSDQGVEGFRVDSPIQRKLVASASRDADIGYVGFPSIAGSPNGLVVDFNRDSDRDLSVDTNAVGGRVTVVCDSQPRFQRALSNDKAGLRYRKVRTGLSLPNLSGFNECRSEKQDCNDAGEQGKSAGPGHSPLRWSLPPKEVRFFGGLFAAIIGSVIIVLIAAQYAVRRVESAWRFWGTFVGGLLLSGLWYVGWFVRAVLPLASGG